MSDVQNESAPLAADDAVKHADADGALAPRHQVKPRSTRSESGAGAPEGVPAEESSHRRAPRAADDAAGAASAPSKRVSAEVAQARALAQISQAQVARRQRREEQAAAEFVASGMVEPVRERREGASHEPQHGAEGEAKPAKTRRTKRSADAAEVEEKGSAAPASAAEEKAPRRTRARKRPAGERSEGAEAASAISADGSEISRDDEGATRKTRRRTARVSDRVVEPAVASTAAPTEEATPAASAAPAPEQIAIPLVDPALRPHRRGRKPKAYVEAERAAAAALAAQQAAAARAQEDAVAAPEGASLASVAGQQGSEEKTSSDNRPGRSRRTAEGKRASKHEAASESEQQADATASVSEDAAMAGGTAPVAVDAPFEAAAQEADANASHHGDETVPEGEAFEGKRDRSARERRQHKNRDERSDRNDRRGNRQDRGDRNDRRNSKRKNRYEAPTEPSVSRDELAALKVAELRERARELDIDVAGKKKAELVEEVYQAIARAEGFREITGILDITNDGFGYIRARGYMPSRDDAFVPANLIRGARLRAGDLIEGTLRPSRANDKFPGLAKIKSVNGVDPEEIRTRPKFSDLTPIYPNEPLKMEHGRDSITGRAIDIVSPIGKGQRGLIVSPPKAGKTTVLKNICQSIAINNPEVHLICLLVDERPEEVTDMQRSIKGDVVASTFDMPADNHTRVSELVIERAKRIVEMGGDVVVVLDSITRLARAYNLAAPVSGRILSGGVDSAALYPPKRFLGAARNIENGGSLTILASALIDTGSKMDEVIFEEFKGTGNMELKLDRDLADRRIFPAIDPVASGTRNEDLLVSDAMRPFVWGIRRILANMNNTERAAASFIKGLKSTNSNEEFLIRSAKKAADHPDAL